jgi:hypothetical protein
MEEDKREILTSNVEMSEIDQSIYKNFDFDFDGTTSFEAPRMPSIDGEFSIGVIFGSRP